MKTKMKKRLFSILLCLVMLTGLMPTTSFAQSGTGAENNPYVATTYAQLKELMANAPTDGTVRYIRLGNNITSEDINNDYSLTLVKEDQKVVLDLAGYTITRKSSITVDRAVIRAKEGKLTINDSVGTGGVCAKGKIPSAIGMTSTDPITFDTGTIVINGGTYTAEYSLGQGAYIESGNLYIAGGTFKGVYGLYAQCGQTYIYGGKFYTTETGGAALSLAVDQTIEVYNLTAYGKVISNSAKGDLWAYISKGNVYIDNVKQSKKLTNIFAGNVIRIETDIVDEINITIPTPVVGNTLETSADVPFGAGYEIVTENGEQVLSWFKGDKFAAGTIERLTEYKLRVYVKVTDVPFVDICAKVNGQPAKLEFKLESMEGDRYYWIEYTFPATEDNRISSVNVDIPVPVAGSKAIAGVIDKSDKYNVSVGWSSVADGSALNDYNGKTFAAGKTYYADVYLNSEDPYIFADGAIVFVNDKEYKATWTVGESYKKYAAVYDVPFTVSGSETYTVSFNANGGTGVIADETEQLGGYVLPECTFIAPTGMRFKCWAEGSAGGKQYSSGYEYDVQSNVTFYAVWEKNAHTCVFNQETDKTEFLKTAADCTHDAVYYKSCTCTAISDTETFTKNGTALGHKWPEAGKWSKDTERHWYECERCHDKKDAAVHNYGNDNVCDTCKYDKAVIHKHNLTLFNKKDATCTEYGNDAYYTCDGCDKWFKDAAGSVEIKDKTSVILKAKGHTAEWKTNETGHWKECECGYKAAIASHAIGDWVTGKKATAAADGIMNRECTACHYVMETAKISHIAGVKPGAVKYTYSGSVKTPSVKVTDADGNVLVKDTDYSVAYPTGRKAVGKYTVKIVFKGNYEGTKSFSFTIKPKTAKIKSLTAGSRKLTVKAATKVSATGGTVYQIAYKQKGTSTWKYTTTTSYYKTIKSLKKGKQYYVKMRAYRKSGTTRYYGSWSTVKLSKAVK